MDEKKYRQFKRGLCISCDTYSNKTYFFVLAHFPSKWRRQCIAVVRTQIITFREKAQCFVARWAQVGVLSSVSAEGTVFCGTLSSSRRFEFSVSRRHSVLWHTEPESAIWVQCAYSFSRRHNVLWHTELESPVWLQCAFSFSRRHSVLWHTELESPVWVQRSFRRECGLNPSDHYTLDVGMTVPNKITVLMIRSQGNPTHQNDTLSLYAGDCCGMIKTIRKCKSAS